MPCSWCSDARWMCETHPERPFPHDDCAGPGCPCLLCNVGEPPAMPDGFQSIASASSASGATVSGGDPFFRPGQQLPVRQPRAGDPLWSMRVGGVSWSCELRNHGERVGVEAQILRDGEFVIGRRFDTRALAVRWAEIERAALVAENWREFGR